ncbi:hypothetical protein [Leptospira kmetyi]|uniref:Lipoprotein n=1 Tax=Leptospira kmetyi TaxID=408139 RepID=A0AAD0UNQ7_9LEPT|nr:hypothetical protein [Leptospira kmetyi]AYV54840.1 hypothetical protein EFP84_04450 [Leptospira kmetyi]EQA54976.1 hypothetical protein LEP1GSC052_0666 [Leptospira kmetyi serovar Malaysia str. Bejo-Iso9]PJZ30072.1 hypothetical protein CH378_09565 [Leptospira kmetyi]PJZ42759.1 hypothetical protein CH370_06025 [Leptospira kmetyi]
MKFRIPFLLCILFLLFFANCSSDHVVIQRPLTGEEKTLGRVQGSACGFLGVLVPWYYFFPIQQNSKVERAYNYAVQQIPGARGLKNITIEETWFWAVLGITQCMTISGDAIR